MYKKHLLKTYLVMMLLLPVLVLGACSQPADDASGGDTDPADAAPVQEWSITVEVVGGETTEFTNLDAQEIGPAEIKVAVKDKDSVKEEGVWTGVLLKDILEFAGVTEFSVVSVEAADGYSREYEPELANSEGTAIGWICDGEPLGEEGGFVKLVVDGKGSNWQIKQVAKIVVIK